MLFKYLPEYYAKSRESLEIQEAMDPSVYSLWHCRDDLMLQLNVDTASWGLSLWEKMLGLEIGIGTNQERRAKIKSRLRGRGTATRQMLQSVAENFLGSGCQVIEYNSDYRFAIAFQEQNLTNESHFRKALEEIKPAHLDYFFRRIVTTQIHTVNRFVLMNFVVFSHCNNWFQSPICFDGAIKFDREICFNQKILIRHSLNLQIQTGIKNLEKIHAQLVINSHFMFNNTVAFDGSKKFNGNAVYEL